MRLGDIKNLIENRNRNILGEEQITKFAVLLPLINKNGETHILFEERAHHMRRQPGEICFPGGRIDPTDKNEQETAIRETCEELGLQKHDIEIIAPLDYVVTQFKTIIYPYAGFIHNPDDISENPDEVEETFTIPLSYFLNNKPESYKVHYSAEPEDDFPTHLLVGGDNYKWRGKTIDQYFYKYNGKVIWGLTAKILLHFIQLLKGNHT